jgi:1-deoxy-D-xylulose-5-phosphate synthase
LNAMPNMVIAQPRNGGQLKALLESCFEWNLPTAIRYPNLKTTDEQGPKTIPLGKGEVLKEGKDLTIVALGHMIDLAFEVSDLLLLEGIDATIIDPIFIKPLDKELLRKSFDETKAVVTIEEHALQGGMGSIINNFIVQERLSDLSVWNFGIPDELIPHGSHKYLLNLLGMSPKAITESILKTFQRQMAKVP